MASILPTTASRRASTTLFAFLVSPTCRNTERRARRCAINNLHSSRPISTTPRRRQEAPITARSTPQPPSTASDSSPLHNLEPAEPLRSLTESLSDPPPFLSESERQVDWTRSYHGLSSSPFTADQSAILMQEIDPADIEIKPDGIIYLPEIKYRRILNKAFGPGGWGLAPRGETIVTGKLVTREYGLVCNNRLVSIARGEQQYFDPDGIPTATEGCKSNALMRCCKDLGIASELWDPRFVRTFIRENTRDIVVENVMTKKRRRHVMRKDDEIRPPWKEVSVVASGASGAMGGGGGGSGGYKR